MEKAITFIMKCLFFQVVIVHVLYILIMCLSYRGNCTTLKGELIPCSFLDYISTTYALIFFILSFVWPVIFLIMLMIAYLFYRFKHPKTEEESLRIH
jgi:hypothetical protein